MDKDQLFNDPSFVNWALGKDENDRNYWEQVLKDHPEQADRILTARGQYISEHRDLNGIDLNEEWSDISLRIDQSERNRRNRSRMVGISMAALLVLLFFGVLAYYHRSAQPATLDQLVVTQPGEISSGMTQVPVVTVCPAASVTPMPDSSLASQASATRGSPRQFEPIPSRS